MVIAKVASRFARVVTRSGLLAVLILLQVGFVAWVGVYWEGGVLDTEATLFVTSYLDDRPFLRQVFDPDRNDFENYQARELSYAFDWVDARALDSLFRRGVVLLVPLSALVGSLALLVVLPAAVRPAFPELPAATAALALLVYLSHFVFLSSAGLFYRSGKILLVPLVVVLAALVVRAARRGEPEGLGGRILHGAGIFTLGCLASLLDRQGFFEVGVAAVLALAGLAAGRRLHATLVGLASSLAVAVAYNLWLAPFLVERLNGYRPSFAYQAVDVGRILHRPVRLAQAAELLASYSETLLGGIPAAALVALVVVVAGAWLLRPGRRRPRVTALAAAAAIVLGHGLMLVIMIQRHKAMYTLPDHRLAYYPLVFEGVLLFALCALLALVIRLWGRPARVLANAALALIVIANVLAWPRHRARMEPWFPDQVRQSALLKRSLQRGEVEPELHHYYRSTFDVLAARRAAGGSPRPSP
jgi:hypothetical protein